MDIETDEERLNSKSPKTQMQNVTSKHIFESDRRAPQNFTNTLQQKYSSGDRRELEPETILVYKIVAISLSAIVAPSSSIHILNVRLRKWPSVLARGIVKLHQNIKKSLQNAFIIPRD